MNTSTPLLTNQYLAVGAAEFITSESVVLDGNHAVLAVLVRNSQATPTMSYLLQGSYDGESWEDIGTALTIAAFGHANTSGSAVDYGFLRVRATISGSVGDKILFDAVLAMSEQ